MQDHAYPGTKKQQLVKQLILVKVNQEAPQFLAVPINKLEAKLSRGKKIQTDLEYEVKFAKSKLLRLDGVDKLLSKQIVVWIELLLKSMVPTRFQTMSG